MWRDLVLGLVGELLRLAAETFFTSERDQRAAADARALGAATASAETLAVIARTADAQSRAATDRVDGAALARRLRARADALDAGDPG